jgi:hypothetical protein
MIDIVLILLQTLKIVVIGVGGLVVIAALALIADLLREELDVYQKAWGTSDRSELTNDIRRHRATRAHRVKATKDDESWVRYFFVDISRKKISKSTPFTHPYIARHPKLHRHVFELELSHA